MARNNGRVLSLFILFTLLLPPSLSSAQERVVPSSRVTSHLKVRALNNVNSQIVGRLLPNESAEFLESVPYWYHIRLDDGPPGYVSKAYSEKISVAEESGQVVRLGSWNIKNLGYDNSKDFQLVAQIIESNFDILVILEVMRKGGGHPGYDTLLTTLGSGWGGLVTDTPRPNTTAVTYAEFYAVLYRNALVRPCNGWSQLIYHTDNDGSSNASGPPDNFSREPAYGCFEAPMNTNTVGVDFMLAAFHALGTGHSVTLRKAEAGHLNEVFQAMEASRPGERDLLIAGDFNLVPRQLRQAVTYSVNTQGTGSTLDDGERTDNLYDHLLVYDEAATSEMIGDPEIIDIRNVATSNLVFFQTISDHLPIVVRMRSSGPDDD
ncbi:SH3 domain-containing protein [Thermodesulfobacteriota bacterium]